MDQRTKITGVVTDGFPSGCPEPEWLAPVNAYTRKAAGYRQAVLRGARGRRKARKAERQARKAGRR